MHRKHAFSIPFENLSPFTGEPVLLEHERLFEKLVLQRRGGYCFELNGLYAWLLSQLGYDFQVFLGRVQTQSPEPGPLTHQFAIVRLGGREWLCDVGFGGRGIRAPMPLEIGRVEIQDSEAFRLTESAHFGIGLQQQMDDGSWMPLYWFRRDRIQPMDIVMANHFCSTWEKSIFRTRLLCTRPFEGGKHILTANELMTRRSGAVETRELKSGAEAVTALREKLGLEFPEPLGRKISARFEELKV